MELKTVEWSFEGIKAVIIYHRFRGSKLKTLLIEFPKNVLTLSTKCGFRMIRYICNNTVPREFWNLVHEEEGQRVYLKGVFSTLNIPQENSIILLTGVDMENLAIRDERFENFRVSVFVTAGVESNALRVGVDRAGYIEENGAFKHVGTINTIVITNASLSIPAFIRAVVIATEAKVIALQDLDIRSSYNPDLQATGTGTDNLVIASLGTGPKVNYVSGHVKIGEIMARAVTLATKDAITKCHRGNRNVQD